MTAAPEDIAAMRADGDLLDYIRSLTGRPPKQRQAEPKPEPKPCYHIRRPGAWPCGTAPTGPTPKPCTDCQPPERTST
ncbi:hypothetical protein SGL43_06621 [Streptomyces globisporus]|uniref:Uncharacterized protein n=1 Tax=Streptomyces globisporus TaxID=1908 RepID=A0ABN8VEV2_STRGL|nr:hypothetical protein [Streptomyces globisporus]CAH9419566.1 hypothetical protein SGL43_06621 [Streptomyces globisporus]